jgi:hypothetical protein
MTEPTTQPVVTQPAQGAGGAERTKLLNAAYAAANKRLREENLDRFRELQVEEARNRGIDYTPKPTAEEKAEQQLADLLAANPALRQRVTDEVLAQQGG